MQAREKLGLWADGTACGLQRTKQHAQEDDDHDDTAERHEMERPWQVGPCVDDEGNPGQDGQRNHMAERLEETAICLEQYSAGLLGFQQAGGAAGLETEDGPANPVCDAEKVQGEDKTPCKGAGHSQSMMCN